MPIIKSAKKRVRTATKAAIRNSKTKRSLRVALKSFDAKATSESVSRAQSALDTAVKKGIISKNKAARKKRSLSANAKSSGVKVTAKAKAKTTTAAKKAPAKKKTTKTAKTTNK